MNSAITAFFTALSEYFKSSTVSKERQSETTVIRDNKKDNKALNWAEKLIFYVDRNYDVAEDKDYQKYRSKFFKYN